MSASCQTGGHWRAELVVSWRWSSHEEITSIVLGFEFEAEVLVEWRKADKIIVVSEEMVWMKYKTMVMVKESHGARAATAYIHDFGMISNRRRVKWKKRDDKWQKVHGNLRESFSSWETKSISYTKAPDSELAEVKHVQVKSHLRRSHPVVDWVWSAYGEFSFRKRVMFNKPYYSSFNTASTYPKSSLQPIYIIRTLSHIMALLLGSVPSSGRLLIMWQDPFATYGKAHNSSLKHSWLASGSPSFWQR